MNKLIVANNSIDVQSLVDQWLKDEQNGVQFPVDFDIAWQIAGYSTKANAKAKGLNKLEKGIDFSSLGMKSSQGGRSVELIGMTCDAFKHFCLMAKTQQGSETRQYFIEAEKKWKLVEKLNPAFAQEIEILKIKAEIAKNEAIKAKSEESLITLKHYIVTALPEPIQQKILGYQTIKQTEVIEKTVDTATGKSYDGVGITYIAKTLGLTNKQAWGFLETIGYGEDSEKWKHELTAITSKKLSKDDAEYIFDLYAQSKK
jgi:hypothetical protein